MFDIDHSAFMAQVAQLWAIVNYGNYAQLFINLLGGFGVFLVVRNWLTGQEDTNDAPEA
jgi:hypothetical protein